MPVAEEGGGSNGSGGAGASTTTTTPPEPHFTSLLARFMHWVKVQPEKVSSGGRVIPFSDESDEC